MQDPTIASCEARRFGEQNPSHLFSKFPLHDPDDLRFPILQFAHERIPAKIFLLTTSPASGQERFGWEHNEKHDHVRNRRCSWLLLGLGKTRQAIVGMQIAA